MDLVLDEGQSVRDLLGVVLALRVFFFLKKKKLRRTLFPENSARMITFKSFLSLSTLA